MKKSTKTISMIAGTIASALLMTTSVSAVEIEEKASVIADVVNSLSPKKDGDVTVNGAKSYGAEVIIDVVFENKSLSALGASDFSKIAPILEASFKSGVCAETSQREFIKDGGSISYDISIGSERSMKVTTSECLEDSGKTVKEAIAEKLNTN